MATQSVDLRRTLEVVRELNRNGWVEIRGFDPGPCEAAGLIERTPFGYRLTAAGKSVLNSAEGPTTCSPGQVLPSMAAASRAD